MLLFSTYGDRHRQIDHPRRRHLLILKFRQKHVICQCRQINSSLNLQFSTTVQRLGASFLITLLFINNIATFLKCGSLKRYGLFFNKRVFNSRCKKRFCSGPRVPIWPCELKDYVFTRSGSFFRADTKSYQG